MSAHVPAKLGQALTDQEKSILRDIANGYTRQATADRHFIALATLKTHLRRVSVKLGSLSTTHSITLAGLQAPAPSPSAKAVVGYWSDAERSESRTYLRRNVPELARLLDDLTEELS